MTTENIIYKPLSDTETNLLSNLVNGEFGFSNNKDSIVYKNRDGTTKVINGSSSVITKGNTLPDTTLVATGTLFLLQISTSTNEAGLYELKIISTVSTWININSIATTVLDGLMSSSDKSKLDGIEAGAEVNVQADWDSTGAASGAIKNKPTTITSNQAAAIVLNTAKVSNIQSDYTATTIEDGAILNKPTTITSNQAAAIVLNTAKKTNIQSDFNATTEETGAILNHPTVAVTSVTTANGLNLSNGTLSLNQINLSDTETFTTKALRNANTTTVWHKGDVAIITIGTNKGSYIYTGTDQTSAGITVDADWTHLVTPTDVVSSVNARTGTVTVTENVKGDWDETNPAEESYIQNKPTAAIALNTAKLTYPAEDKTKLSLIEANAEVNVQSDYSETDNNEDSFIKNKPTTISTTQASEITANTAKVSNIQANWTGTTPTNGQILNKPFTINDIGPQLTLPLNPSNGQVAKLVSPDTYINANGSQQIAKGLRFFESYIIPPTTAIISSTFTGYTGNNRYLIWNNTVSHDGISNVSFLKNIGSGTGTPTKMTMAHNAPTSANPYQTYSTSGNNTELLINATGTGSGGDIGKRWVVAYNNIGTSAANFTTFNLSGLTSGGWAVYRDSTAIYNILTGLVTIRSGLWTVDPINPTSFGNVITLNAGVTNITNGADVGGGWFPSISNGVNSINYSTWH